MSEVPTSTRLSGVDSVRGVAALLVLVCHAQAYCLAPDHPLPWPLPQLANNASHGVDLFVVVSGFCLALPLVHGRTLHVVNFLRRRALRLMPAYYVALAAAALLALLPMTWRLVVPHRAQGSDVAAYGLFLQTLLPGRIGAINGSMWSVALEVQLYLCFPATLLLVRRLGAVRLIAATGALSIAWALLGTFHIGSLGDEALLPARLVQFVVGMWVAERVVAHRLPRRAVLWGALLVGTFAGLTVSTLVIMPVSAVTWAIPSASLLMLFVGAERVLAGGLERFGALTYSFYLLHQPVLLLLAPALRALTTSPVLLLIMALLGGAGATSILAALLYRWVEEPTQAYARRWRITVGSASPTTGDRSSSGGSAAAGAPAAAV